MSDSTPSQVPENQTEARRWVEQSLDERAGQPWSEPSSGFAERVLERIDAAPLTGLQSEGTEQRARPHLRWIALAAGLLVTTGVLFFTKPWASGEHQPPQMVLGVNEHTLGFGLGERMLTEEWEAILADARSMLVAMGTALPN